MCGVCGYWDNGGEGAPHEEILKRMVNEIVQRGPDGTGYIAIPSGPAFAHARLSIIDVSEAGAQPMLSAGGRFTIVYNGETYNHMGLRRKLEVEGASPVWVGHSDTETILACFDAWGIEKTVKRMTGMFAFAVWDEEQHSLTLVRDRLGEKPLYFGITNDVFIFGSELSSLHRHPDFHGTVDRDALTTFLQRSYVPGPFSIYSEIKKLQPGQLLTVTRGSNGGALDIVIRPYWVLNEEIERGRRSPFNGSDSDAAKALDIVLTDVIENQMISDVPLGAFLSGGIDSSLVVALMQKVSSGPVRTFSVGFEDKQFDESESARAMAAHLGTDHVELIVTPEHIMDLIPRLPDIYCEPFADSSQLPTFIVSELARKHVTVALTGDGADEIFGGYNRYIAAGRVWKNASLIPSPIRTVVGNAILSVPKSSWDSMFNAIYKMLSQHQQPRVPGEKIHKVGRLLKQKTKSDYFESLISMTDHPASFVIGGHVCRTVIDDSSVQPRTDSFEQWMMALDTLTYLPDDICVKVDRASMANSLETRAPFLDRRVVEFGCSLPLSSKIRVGKSKWILREVLAGYAPRELFERPKMGFGIPFGKWLRGPLCEWAEEILREDRLVAAGYFEPARVRAAWAAHKAGKGNHEYLLWNVLMFNSWLDRWGRNY